MRLLLLLVLTVAAVSVFIPEITSAQGYDDAILRESRGLGAQDTGSSGGLVPCSGGVDDLCGWGEFVELIDNVVTWLFGFLAVAAILLFVYVGFELVTSQGNKTKWEDAKHRFTNVVIGIILVLAAWLIVDTLLRAITDGQRGINDLLPADDTPDVITGSATRGDSGMNSGYQGVISGGGVTPTGNYVEYSGYRFDSAVVDKVRFIDRNYNLRVTSGYRSKTRNESAGGAANSYHLTGRAADFVGSESEMQAAADWARRNGAVEVLLHNVGSGRHLHVAW